MSTTIQTLVTLHEQFPVLIGKYDWFCRICKNLQAFLLLEEEYIS